MSRFAAAVEVAVDAQGGLPVSLITEWYHQSREARVAFLLDGIEPAEIDAVLDPLAPQTLNYRGVTYVSAADSETVAAVLRAADMVVARPGGLIDRYLRVASKPLWRPPEIRPEAPAA